MSKSEEVSPPGSPQSDNEPLTTKQYICVNISKLITEFIGTVGIGVFYFSTQGNSAGMLLSMWIITLFGFNISGAHFNTCITLAQMIRKTKTKMGQSRLLGIMYIVGQILGGILVGFICLSITKDNWELRAREYPEISNQVITRKGFSTYVSEVLGAFIYVLFFLISTDKKTRYSKDKTINCLVIAGSYVAAQGIAGGQTVSKNAPLFNPTVALGAIIWSPYSGSWGLWQYIVMPLVGTILAIVFYELIFVKTIDFLEDDEDEENDQEVRVDKAEARKPYRKNHSQSEVSDTLDADN